MIGQIDATTGWSFFVHLVCWCSQPSSDRNPGEIDPFNPPCHLSVRVFRPPDGARVVADHPYSMAAHA